MHLELAAGEPASWRLPALVVLAVIVIAGVAMAIALSEISDEAGVASRGAGAGELEQGGSREPSRRRGPNAVRERRARGQVAGWPAGTSAYTVALLETESRAEARARALEVAEAGLAAGVLDSDDHSRLRPGRWIAFSGQFDTSRQARDAAERYAGLGFRGGRVAFVNRGR